jgi:hypothetical protein
LQKDFGSEEFSSIENSDKIRWNHEFEERSAKKTEDSIHELRSASKIFKSGTLLTSSLVKGKKIGLSQPLINVYSHDSFSNEELISIMQ